MADSDRVGRGAYKGASLAVEAVHRILWLLATVGAVASLVTAYRGLGQADPMTGLSVSLALAPYVAARSWDELFRED